MKAPVEFNPLGELPVGWTWQPLQNLTANPKQDVVDGPFGSDLKASEYVATGVPIARLQNIDRNAFVTKNIKYLTPEKAAELSRHEFRPNDILITKLGDPLGKACIVPGSIGHGVIVADLVRVRPDEERIDRQYLTYAINSPSVIKQFELHTKGTTRPRVNLSVLRQLPIPVAPRETQSEIVAEIEKQFSRLDDAVANLQRVKANLKRYKAAVLKAAVEGRLVETEATLARVEGRTFETGEQLLQRILEERRGQWQKKTGYKEPSWPALADQSDLPDGWAWACVEQLNPGNRPCAYGVLQPGGDLANGVPFVRVGDINDGMVDFAEMKRIHPDIASAYPRTYLKGGEVLLTLVGAIGRTAVAPTTLAGANVARAVGVLPINEYVDPHWVEIWFRNPAKITEMTGKSHEVARKTLNLEDVRLAAVALPPRPEQTRIVAEVDRQLTIIREVEAEVDTNLKRAQALREATLSKAFAEC